MKSCKRLLQVEMISSVRPALALYCCITVSFRQGNKTLSWLHAGVLWNLSSRDNLKEKLSVDALPVLTEKVLIPLCKSIPLNSSEREIFNNTTGCLRWLHRGCPSTLVLMRQALMLYGVDSASMNCHSTTDLDFYFSYSLVSWIPLNINIICYCQGESRLIYIIGTLQTLNLALIQERHIGKHASVWKIQTHIASFLHIQFSYIIQSLSLSVLMVHFGFMFMRS